MKRKWIARMLAAALVLSLGSGEVLAAEVTTQAQDVVESVNESTGQSEDAKVNEPSGQPEDTAVNESAGQSEIPKTDEKDESVANPNKKQPLAQAGETAEPIANLSYSYNYKYEEPNNSVTLSPATVNAGKAVELAYPIIFANEGGYTSINANDNGAVSVGRIQWHGKRALDILREIIETDPNKAYTLLGVGLYEEITSTATNWAKRTMSSDEAAILKSFLGNMPQSQAVQDKMAKADIASYINHGIKLGIRNVPALIYFADLENQGGSGRSTECAKSLIDKEICSSYGAITLNEMHMGAVYNSVMGKDIYLTRRFSVYKSCVETGYVYCKEEDSVIPYAFSRFSSESYVGEAWLQRALNEYAGASLEITDQYDAQTKAAVKTFQASKGLTADGLAGKATIKALIQTIMNPIQVSRLYEATRYETALQVAEEVRAETKTGRFDAVILTTGVKFADALSGSYLSSEKQAPILLIDKASAPKVIAYVNNNLASGGTVYVLGGSAAVSEDWLNSLKTDRIKRLSGKDRYETNVAILKECGVRTGEILVCTGSTFADSLSASAAKKPIFLVDQSLSASQKTYLNSLSGESYMIIGGEKAVSSNVATELRTYGTTSRISGTTRYETSVAVAKKYVENPKTAVVAYALDFPDGLCGGLLAAMKGAPVILSSEGNTAVAASYVAGVKMETAYVLGGSKRFTDTTIKAIFGNAAKILN